MQWWNKLMGINISAPRTLPEDVITSVPPEPKLPKPNYHKDVILPMVEEKRQEIETKRDEILAQMMDDYQKQFDGYHFSCVRYGDFLNLFIERTANADFGDAFVKFSTAINLSRVGYINVHAGRKPDMDGTTRYYVTRKNQSCTPIFFNGGVQYTHHPPKDNEEDVIKTDIPIDSQPGEFVRMPGEGDDYYSTSHKLSQIIPKVTTNVPRRDVDDKVFLSGIEVTIYVPCGRGEEVKQIILNEIARKYESTKSGILDTPR